MKSAMKRKELKQLHLRTTGGMGIVLEGNVAIEALPEELARQVQTKLTPTNLSRVARRKAPSFAPGQQEYEVTLFAGEKSEPRRYAFTDQQADPELLDLLDEITSIIIEEKMRTRRARRQQAAEPKEVNVSQEPPSLIPTAETLPDAGTALHDMDDPVPEKHEENEALPRASQG